MFECPEDLLYTEDHEWIAIDKEVATIGITDFSQQQRGRIDAIELPAEGRQLEAGRAFAVLHAENTVADVYAPVSGEVIERNEEVEADGERINLSPYEDGWLIKIRIDTDAEIDLLMDQQQYGELVADAQ